MVFKKRKNQKNKIFCIGFNKTGTTTIARVMKDFGYQLGDQTKSELLLKNWFLRDFKSITDFCNTAEGFQDIPFSLPYTYTVLDNYFHNAKFILTIRDNENQWYDSITRYHSRLWSKNNTLPSIKELKMSNYGYLGFAYDYYKYVFNTPVTDIYNETILKDTYLAHNNAVMDYFKGKPESLIVINVSHSLDYFRLCDFLEKKPLYDKFPWENKTKNQHN